MDPIILAAAYVYIREKKLKKRSRRWWVHPINERRDELGEFSKLIHELRLHDDRFRKYFRMTVGEYDTLLLKIGPSLEKKGSNFRLSISTNQRLAITLR